METLRRTDDSSKIVSWSVEDSRSIMTSSRAFIATKNIETEHESFKKVVYVLYELNERFKTIVDNLIPTILFADKSKQ